MPKSSQTRVLINCSKCLKCGTTDFQLQGTNEVKGINIQLYKCVNGHRFQDSYSYGPYKQKKPHYQSQLNIFPNKASDESDTPINESNIIENDTMNASTMHFSNNIEDNSHYTHNDFEPTLTENDATILTNINFNSLNSEDNLNNVVDSVPEVSNNFVNQNNILSNADLITALDFHSPNSLRVINIRDNQILYIENLQAQNVENNYLSFQVQHSSLGIYKYEFKHIPSDIFPFLSDHQILHLVGYYNDINEDCTDQIH